ncbi:MAG TPA: hypothetical protein VHZ56_08355 [Devosia sp.]|nr:hypothetical protein [Devosia sp.]
MTDRPLAVRTRTDFGATALLILALLALIDSIFNYFFTGNGIHGTEGALLVIVSTLLLLIAAGLVGMRRVHSGWRTLLEVLMLLDFIGTAAAAYLLEAWILLALIVLGFIAWVIHVARPSSSRPASNLG